MKKLLIATAILAASSTVAMAAGAPYVGVGLGLNSASNSISINNGTTIKNLGARGALFDVFAGYGIVVNQNIYLGGEVFGSATSAQGKITAPNGNFVRVQTKNSFGISLMPGVMLGEHTLAYLRAGIVRTSFNAANNSAGVYVSKNKSVNGGQLGLGLQTSLAQNIDLRGEYVYTSYRSFNVGAAKVSPNSDQFNLGVIYKFD